MARVVIHEEEIRRLYASDRSPVVQWVVRKSLQVQNQAKAMCPADTGRLRSSITHSYEFHGDYLIARIGTNVAYARWVHDGTGIYGPRGRLIVPVKAQALRWGTHSRRAPTATVRGKRVGGSKSLQPTGFVFAKWSRGMKPRPFLRDALRATNLNTK